MAYKSLLLSMVLTVCVGYVFTFGVTNPDSFLKKLPNWTAIPILAGIFVLYLLATVWAFKGFGAHKMVALFSMGFCTLGLGVYVIGFLMKIGNGRAMPGQYDYNFSRLDPAEKAVLSQIVQNANLTLENAVFTEHWRVTEKSPGFRVCIQKGHITAINFSGNPITDLSLFSRLPKLGDLYLNQCGLADLTLLKSEKLDRLELADNHVSDLKTLAGCPNLRWLVLKNNQLSSTEGIELFKNLVSIDLSGNPVSN